MSYSPSKPTIPKYDSLHLLDYNHFPHPKWLFVTTPDGIPSDPWCNASYGWTIRCAPRSDYFFGLPSRHMLEFDQLKERLKELMVQAPESDAFVIYPSWKFDISGTCLVDSALRLVVEVVKGDIAPLLAGRKTPDAIFIYNLPFCNSAEYEHNEREVISNKDIRYLISNCRRISTSTEVLLEWTKTTEGVILFHDWLEYR